VGVARELLFETQRADGVTVYAPFHEAVRGFLVEKLGPIAVRGVHRELADKLATWPLPREAAARRYALRYAIAHRIAADDHDAIRALAGNVDFLEVKYRELGIDDVELDLRRAAEACADAGQMSLHGELDRLLRLLASESQAPSRDPGADASSLWRRLRQHGRSSGVLDPASSAAEDRAQPAAGGERPGGRAASESAVIGPVASSRYGTVSATGGGSLPRTRTMFPGRPAQLRTISMRGAVTACAVTPDSDRVVAASSDHSIHVLELESGRRLSTLTGHGGTIESCAISPDGRWLVSASADRTLKRWDLDTGGLLGTLTGHAGPVTSCAVTPDGRHVVSASADHTLKVWDVDTGDCAATFEGHTDAVESCAISPDGRWVVSASADTTLKFWDLESCCLLTTFTGHTGAVESCAIAPDGRYVVSGSSDHTLKIWNVSTGSVTTTLKGHAGAVTSCVVAANSRSVYSASSDTTLRIWDVDTGRTVTTLEGHTRAVTCCAVAPNGRRLVSGALDSTLRVWALDGTRPSPVLRTIVQPAPSARPRILFLAAKDASQMHGKEYAAIERELQMAPHGGDFELRSKWALTVDDMARYLLELDPTIIHLRGARIDGAESDRDTAPDGDPLGDSGIWLRDERGGMRLVPGRALKMMVSTTAPSARLVVLNACYSDGHAAELCQVVDCVVGMTRDHAHAALSFAVAFYRMIGNRRSVGEALAHANAMLAVAGIPDECVPRCRTLNWTDPHEISILGPQSP
jgi:hypothetical protein